MSNFMLVVFPAILLGPYLSSVGFPSILTYLPEFAAIAACLIIVSRLSVGGRMNVQVGLLIVLGLLVLHLAFGLIANGTKAGTLIIAARLYFRAIPFFVLALLVFPKPDDLKRQFYIFAAFSAFQAPLAIYQKLSYQQEAILHGGISTTGDIVKGTILSSSLLTVYLTAVVTIVIVLYSRKKIGLLACGLMSLLILIPTMVNETKSTLILAPIAIIVPFIARSSGSRLKALTVSLGMFSLFLLVFIPSYDYFMKPRWGYGIVEFMTMEGRVEGYLSKDADVGNTGRVGKLDTIIIPIQEISDDPVKFVFGFGMGSVTESSFGRRYEGKLFRKYGALMGSTVSRLLWETGWLGLTMVLWFLWLIYRDARYLLSEDSLYGMVAQSYVAVVPIMVLSMLYVDLVQSPILGIIFWYYAGVVVAAATLKRRGTGRRSRTSIAGDSVPNAENISVSPR